MMTVHIGFQMDDQPVTILFQLGLQIWKINNNIRIFSVPPGPNLDNANRPLSLKKYTVLLQQGK